MLMLLWIPHHTDCSDDLLEQQIQEPSSSACCRRQSSFLESYSMFSSSNTLYVLIIMSSSSLAEEFDCVRHHLRAWASVCACARVASWLKIWIISLQHKLQEDVWLHMDVPYRPAAHLNLSPKCRLKPDHGSPLQQEVPGGGGLCFLHFWGAASSH